MEHIGFYGSTKILDCKAMTITLLDKKTKQPSIYKITRDRNFELCFYIKGVKHFIKNCMIMKGFKYE